MGDTFNQPSSSNFSAAADAGVSRSSVANGGRNDHFIHGGIFTLLAFELLLFGMALWYFIVNRHAFPGSTSPLAELVWGTICIAAAAWGTWYLVLSQQAARQWQFGDSIKFLAITVASGAILLGILLVHIARAFIGDAIVMDMRPQYASAIGTAATAETSTALVGDAAHGKKWFLMSCVTCHGPTGEGVLNAAPSLRSSQFLATAEDAAIASLIRLGRAATDPANKTGKVMPAKGGNPFLDEAKIADLVAFLTDLDNQLPGGSPASAPASPVSGNISVASAETSDPPVVVQQWKLADLEHLDIAPTEKSVALGSLAFTKATCNKCHMAAVAGNELGPSLDQIAKKYKSDQLLQHMVEPSREINEKFQTHSFLLFDGRTVTGVVMSESQDEVVVMTDLLKPDELTTIPIDDIDDQVKSKLSPMPTGMLDVLTEQEIAGLVAYLDVVGKQMAGVTTAQLNRWVVPAASNEVTTTTWSPAGMAELARIRAANEGDRSLTTTSSAAGEIFPGTSSKSWSDILKSQNGLRYQYSFSWLFVIATSVLALHFLWVVGSGTAVVLHRELQLSSAIQLQLGRQMFWFWSLGMVWLAVWFLIFFLIG